ncbi:dTDP-4-dehydrorhamnose reductase [Qipengyuania flava]|uniref:dTDP-4-dehydrorhamnose reductase n=1 Tax=Qipengyuania flava TaxID=192812 RepID=UPI001C63644F|nr:dTDP-4-dehydrorhamnose reductase [Qipengyuania flava]QYJ06367.1 dTDP-4-dehydrorhamnose reductase [Qipengyuania flava]
MILVFGKTGQVALELQALAPDAVYLGRDVADLSNPAQCREAILAHRPTAVINAAAYTAVDKAEDEEDQATVINAEAPAAMADACRELGVPFVHISTDYVFDGSGEDSRVPSDPVAPANAYGRSKLAGEEAVKAAGATYAILRTSWVFSPHGKNFAKTMIGLSDKHPELRVVDDQIGGPTPASAIAAACLRMADTLKQRPELSGTYHFSGTPDVSWADFARAIFEHTPNQPTVHGIPTKDYPTPAQRPLNSRLDCSDLAKFGLERPNWESAIPAVIEGA